MRKLLTILAPLAVIAVCSTGVVGAQSSKRTPGSNLHYAYRLVRQTESEEMAVNWNGVILWKRLPKEDALWIQKDGKTFLVTDKSTLEAMRVATMPLRHSPPYSDTEQWHEEREKEHQQVYVQTDKIVAEALGKGLEKPAQMGK